MGRPLAKPRQLSDDESWIVSHNLPLVDYCLRGRKYDATTWQDLQAAGYEGLCHAIRLYDPEIAQWSTYAIRWIRSCIQREFRSRHLLHVPDYHLENSQNETTRRCQKNYGHMAHRSLDAQQVQWDDGEAIATLAVAPTETAVESEEELRRMVEEHLQYLTDRQRIVICRLVMHGDRLTDVAQELGVAPNAVSDLRNRALRVLRISMHDDPRLKKEAARTTP